MSYQPILFAAGGSGGHLFPAIAVAEVLHDRQPERDLVVVASERAIDRSILSRYPWMCHFLSAVSPSLLLKQPWRVVRENWKAWRAACALLKQIHPAVVVGCGGFASVPVVAAAVRRKIPVVLLEQNLMPGQATAWMSRWASKICLSFEETTSYLSRSVSQRAGVVLHTGNPVRQSILTQRTTESRSPNLLLVLGGSQGARHVNEAVVEWILTRPAELRGWRIIHQTGSGDQFNIHRRYACVADHVEARAVEFLDDVGELIQEATLVIGRAGATSLAELAVVGTPTVLIPLPTAARDHQTANAQWYANRNAAILVTQAARPTETASIISTSVTPLLRGPLLRHSLSQAIQATAKSNAASEIADLLVQMTSSQNETLIDPQVSPMS